MKKDLPSFLGLGLDLHKRKQTEALLEQREKKEALDPIPDPLEGTEPYPSGMVALDIIIDKKTGRPYVAEVQGMNSGISGIKELEGNEFLKHKAEAWEQLIERATQMPNISSSTYVGNLEKGYSNPQYVEAIMRNKAEQARLRVVPEAYAPRTVTGSDSAEEFHKLCAEVPQIILKPHNQAKGFGIERFSTADAVGRKQAWEYAQELKKTCGNFVAQEFIEPAGAQAAPQDLKDHYASMRLVTGFHKDQSGEIHLLDSFGYWRVAPYHPDEAGKRVRGRMVRDNDVAVVNKARGAAAVEITEAEYRLTTPVVRGVIERLGEAAKDSPSFQHDRAQIIHEKIEKMETRLRSTYPVSIWNNADQDERGSEERYRFLFRLEKELGRIWPDIWKMGVMRRWNTHCNVKRVMTATGELRGSIELSYYILHKSEMVKETFEFSAEEPGALRKVVEGFAKEHSK